MYIINFENFFCSEDSSDPDTPSSKVGDIEDMIQRVDLVEGVKQISSFYK